MLRALFVCAATASILLALFAAISFGIGFHDAGKLMAVVGACLALPVGIHMLIFRRPPA